MRSGLIAQKLGMTRVYNDAGEQIPVTVLKVDNLQVVSQRTEEKNGYSAVQLGAGLAKVKNTTKPMRGHFAAAKVEPKRKLAEFRVSVENMLDVGVELRMAGHMGSTRITTQNLEVVRTDADRGLLMIKGAVPGSKGAWILIKDANKKALPDNVPMPAALKGGAAAPAEEAPAEASEGAE